MTDKQRNRRIVIDYMTSDGVTHRVEAVLMYAREIDPGYNPGRTRQPSQLGKRNILTNMKVGETIRQPFFGVGGFSGWHSTRSYLKTLYRDPSTKKPICDWRFALDELNAEIIITRIA